MSINTDDTDVDENQDLNDYYGNQSEDNGDIELERNDGDYYGKPLIEIEDPQTFDNYDHKKKRLIPANDYYGNLPRSRRSKRQVQAVLLLIRELQSKGFSDRAIMYSYCAGFGVSISQFYRYLRRIRLENEWLCAYRKITKEQEIQMVFGLEKNYVNLRQLAFDPKMRLRDCVRALSMMAQASIDRYYVLKHGLLGLNISPKVHSLTRRETERVCMLVSKVYGEKILKTPNVSPELIVN